MCTLNYSLEEETRFFVKMKSYFPCFLSTFLTTFAFTSHHVALINLTNDNKYPFHPHLFPAQESSFNAFSVYRQYKVLLPSHCV